MVPIIFPPLLVLLTSEKSRLISLISIRGLQLAV